MSAMNTNSKIILGLVVIGGAYAVYELVLKKESKEDNLGNVKSSDQRKAMFAKLSDDGKLFPKNNKGKREKKGNNKREPVFLPSEQRSKKSKLKKGGISYVKASVSKAIADLVEAKPEKYAKKSMAMQMLYSKFNNESEAEFNEDSKTFKILDKEGWIAHEQYTFKSTYSSDVISSITAKGKSVLESIRARIVSLQVKKQGGELFDNLKGK